MELFVDGNIDAFLGFPPEPVQMRSRSIGHVVVNSAVDRPWSQYLCCYLVGNARYFVRGNNPVATKRVLRAILKAADLCVADPERVAAPRDRRGSGFTCQFELHARQALMGVFYAKWRDYDAEDTVRFYTLRLHEAGMIKSSPQGDHRKRNHWRFFNELKREIRPDAQ